MQGTSLLEAYSLLIEIRQAQVTKKVETVISNLLLRTNCATCIKSSDFFFKIQVQETFPYFSKAN